MNIEQQQQQQQHQQKQQPQRPVDPTPPDDLLCPITQEIFVHPVHDIVWGNTYERSAILAWLAANGTCPLTRRPMRPWELMTNKIMMEKVDCWRRQHGKVLPKPPFVLFDNDSRSRTSESDRGGQEDDDSLRQQQQQQSKGLTGSMVGYISMSPPSPAGAAGEEAPTPKDVLAPPPLPHPTHWYCHQKKIAATTPTLDDLLEEYEDMMSEIELLEKEQQEEQQQQQALNKLHSGDGGKGQPHEGDDQNNPGDKDETVSSRKHAHRTPALNQALVEDEEEWWWHHQKQSTTSGSSSAKTGGRHHQQHQDRRIAAAGEHDAFCCA
jgi:U-box domain